MGLKVPPNEPTDDTPTSRGGSKDHKIIPMNDFLVLLRPKTLLNLGGLEALDFYQGVRRTIHEPLGEFLAVRVEAADRITGLKRASDCDDTGRQEALAALGQGVDGSLIQ